MKVPEIKRLVESVPYDVLVMAEQEIMNDKELSVEVNGVDEGEKLTHVLAALWIMNAMRNENKDFNSALRAYTLKVRESIN